VGHVSIVTSLKMISSVLNSCQPLLLLAVNEPEFLPASSRYIAWHPQKRSKNHQNHLKKTKGPKSPKQTKAARDNEGIEHEEMQEAEARKVAKEKRLI
jgi:hypothetical protein